MIVSTFLIAQLIAAVSGTFPSFTEHIVNSEAEVVYAVDAADINGDKMPDIVGVSATYVAWYENPTWRPHRIVNQLKNDNVCVSIWDIDGDGVPEIAIGADWQPNNTASGGALYLLRHQGDPAKEWAVVPLKGPVPTLHRIRWADVNGDGKKELVCAPLKGVGSTPPDFNDRPARLFVLYPGAQFDEDAWREETIDESLHVCHNIWPLRTSGDVREALLAASFEGVTKFKRESGGSWTRNSVVQGNYEPPPRAGAGEIKTTPGEPYLMATIEPWHANQVVVYTLTAGDWKREVVDDTFAGGHLVYWADFDGDGDYDLLAGHREKSPVSQSVGLYVYESKRADGASAWQRHAIDVGGMATEDGIAADLNGDGKMDIIAGGRATHNIKFYENEGAAK